LRSENIFSGSFARFGVEFIKHTFERSLNHIFYSPLPMKEKERIRAFQEGIIKPFFIFLASLVILIIIKYFSEVSPVISILIMFFSLAWFFVNLLMRGEYKKTLIRTLILNKDEEKEKIFNRFMEIAADDTEKIIENLLNSNDNALILFALDMIYKYKLKNFTNEVLKIFSKEQPEFEPICMKILLEFNLTPELFKKINISFNQGSSEFRQKILLSILKSSFSEKEELLREWLILEDIDTESFILIVGMLVSLNSDVYVDFIRNILSRKVQGNIDEKITVFTILKNINSIQMKSTVLAYLDSDNEILTRLALSISVRDNYDEIFERVLKLLKDGEYLDLLSNEIPNMEKNLVYQIYSQMQDYESDVRRLLWFNLPYVTDVKILDMIAEKGEFTDDLVLEEKIEIMVQIKERLSQDAWEKNFKDNIDRSYLKWFQLMFEKVQTEALIFRGFKHIKSTQIKKLFMLFHREQFEKLEKLILDLIYLIIPGEEIKRVRLMIGSENKEIHGVAMELLEHILISHSEIKHQEIITELFESYSFEEKIIIIQGMLQDLPFSMKRILEERLNEGELFEVIITSLILIQISPHEKERFENLYQNKKGADEMLNVINRLMFLKDIVLFKNMNLDTLLKISMISNFTNYSAGEIIINENQEGKALYILTKGNVLVGKSSADEWVKIAELSEGEFFGEMSIFTNDLTSADVRAKTECEVLIIEKERFHKLILENPEISFEIFSVLSKRLRNITQKEFSIYTSQDSIHI
ncbi:MAG: cyclic nucleotide-binding domain-containing protein, partial [bacterium]|nr:cyclic nucleotide-binding domain-containing protein [bacterium]